MQNLLSLAVRTIIGLLLLTSWNVTRAQDMPRRYPMLELFTNTPCPICGSQNPGLFNRLGAYEGMYHLISFYPGRPYASCIFYQANISENTARLNFYPQVFGTPTVVINGTQFSNSNGVTNTVLNNITGHESWLHIDVDETTGNTRTVDITLTDHAGGSLATGKLFAVIVERQIMYNAPNGEALHHNVFRKFLTGVNGDDVDLSSGMAGVTYEYTIEAPWQANEVYVIAWLMDPDTKEIYNSGTRFDPDFTASTADHPGAVRLAIYPNPATSEVQIVLPEMMYRVPVRVFDARGQLVHEQFSASDTLIHVSTGDWPVGSYYVEISNGNRTFYGSFQVVRE